MFTKGNNLGKGRPPGSSNKIPNRDELVNLLNDIITDISSQYHELTLQDKILILKTFRGLWVQRYPEIIALNDDNEIRVTIVKPEP